MLFLPFAPLDWIQTTGTLTICPAKLDTHQSKRQHWNTYHLPRWIDTHQSNANTGTPTICPAELDTHQSKRQHWNAHHLPRWIDTDQSNANTGTPTICPVGLIHTKANANTGTLTICPAELDTDQSKRQHWNTYHLPRWIDTDNWNAYHLPRWIGYRQLERLLFAPLDWIQTKTNAHTGTPTICPVGLIQTTGTRTICPVGLDTDNWNAYHLPRWIGYRQLERLLFAPLDWIQTKATPTLERSPFAPLNWIHTKANANTGTLTIYPAVLDTDQSNANTGTIKQPKKTL